MPHTMETRKKISEATSKAMKKKWQDSEFRKKNVTSRKGRVVTQKTREKISNSLRGKPKAEKHRTALKMAWKKRKQEYSLYHEE